MKTSIATVSISGNLREKLEAIAAAGFEAIEVFEPDLIAFDASPREVGGMIRDLGLEISMFQPFRDFECLPPPLRSKAFDRAERKFDVMQELGANLILVCSTVHPAALGGIDRAAVDLRELGDRARERGIRIGYEALAWGRHINDHRDAWEIVRRTDHPSVGLVLDSFHSLSRKIGSESIRAIPGDRIFCVQLSDAPAIEMDLLHLSRHLRNMPGEGDLPVTDFMRAVMATGYDGPVSLEVFNDYFRGGDARLTARDGYRSLVTILDDVRRAEPEVAGTLPDIPVRVAPEGVAFVEFSTRGDEARGLEALLSTLGFRKAARHRNKAVTLWRQGAIRIVLNEETTGYAASAWAARGTTVCDIGLRVASAGDAETRALATGAERFTQPHGPGELDIPAIRGLSGSVLHFLDDGTADTVWDAEFDPLETTAEDAGLTGIDHLAQTMSYADMLSWVLFYTSILAVRKTPVVDVIDPDGLVRSQSVSSADGRLRITLNGADSRRTLAGRLMSETFGAPLQHLAMTTNDIFGTSERLAAKGFEALPMTENYYADLASRFDLAPDVMVRLKRWNILYDADAGGEFFQMYSRSFAGGIFFEIVERRGGYCGYGAPNAPYRTAAQKRLLRGKGIPSV